MGPPNLPHEQHDTNAMLDDNESIEQATIESSSIIADEEPLQMPHHRSRKRKRRMSESRVLSISEQEHILYGDQLLDYFVTVGDRLSRFIRAPQPPDDYQVDYPVDNLGNTALHWACSMGDLNVIHDLLERGANVNAVSMHDETPLIRAVLFTNNYEKQSFPAVLDLLMETIGLRDWFGATLFHHIAQTTRSKGKWKSAKYYSQVAIHKLRNAFTQEEIDLLLCCQDNNGDTAALVAARNGATEVVEVLLKQCPRAGDLMNKKGETVASITREFAANAHQAEPDVPPAPSSVTMANDQVDGAPTDTMPPNQSSNAAPVHSALTSELLSKIGTIMSEAHKKLASTYGNSKLNEQGSTDVTNPEALYQQLESDREKIQKQVTILMSKEAELEPSEAQLSRHESVRTRFESLLEQRQHALLASKLTGDDHLHDVAPKVSHFSQQELEERFELMGTLFSEQMARRNAVKDLAQQTADAGVSTKFDVHRRLVALATNLKEEELDPMAAELAETLEFDRNHGKGSPPEPEQKILPPRQD